MQLNLIMKKHQHESDRQSALTMTCPWLFFFRDIFRISKSLTSNILNHVTRELVTRLFNEFVKLPTTEDEWVKEIIGFIENDEFPRTGTLDEFHVFTETKLKNFYIFKNSYSNSNTELN